MKLPNYDLHSVLGLCLLLPESPKGNTAKRKVKIMSQP